MTKEHKPPKEAFVAFSRSELKKVYFGKGEDGTFYTFTKFLDKDTLEHRRSPCARFRESSIRSIARMYITEFMEGNVL